MASSSTDKKYLKIPSLTERCAKVVLENTARGEVTRRQQREREKKMPPVTKPQEAAYNSRNAKRGFQQLVGERCEHGQLRRMCKRPRHYREEQALVRPVEHVVYRVGCGKTLKKMAEFIKTAEDFRKFLSVLDATGLALDERERLSDIMMKLLITQLSISSWAPDAKIMTPILTVKMDCEVSMAVATPRALVVLDQAQRNFYFYRYDGHQWHVPVPALPQCECARPWDVYWSEDGWIVKLDTIEIHRQYTAPEEPLPPLTTNSSCRAICDIISLGSSEASIKETRYVDVKEGQVVPAFDPFRREAFPPPQFYREISSKFIQKLVETEIYEPPILCAKKELRNDSRYRIMGMLIKEIQVMIHPNYFAEQCFHLVMGYRGAVCQHGPTPYVEIND